MSRMINTVNFEGFIGRDPETSLTAAGKKRVRFSIANTEEWGPKESRQKKTVWQTVNCFGKLADIAERIVRKGDHFLISGSVDTREFDDQKTGKKVRFHSIRAIGLKRISKSKKDVQETQDAVPLDTEALDIDVFETLEIDEEVA